MPSLKEIRTRIVSVQSTQKITSAMKLVSAAKLRRAQHSISTLKPYSNKLNAILHNLSCDLSTGNPLFTKREPKNVLLIAITSNRGLCGAFNSNVIKEINREVNDNYKTQPQKGKLKIICIGKKGMEQLRKNFEILDTYETLVDTPNFEELSKIVSSLIDDFCQKKIDKIDIVYNSFVNPATQKIKIENFLPITIVEDYSSKKSKKTNFILEPSENELVDELIPKILKIQLFKIILDSIAAEHGARMTSMTKATENAAEILRELKLKYNNARQAVITNELNEIEGGAEALKG